MHRGQIKLAGKLPCIPSVSGIVCMKVSMAVNNLEHLQHTFM